MSKMIAELDDFRSELVSLARGQIQICTFSTVGRFEEAAALLPLLSNDERHRLARLASAELCRRFIMRRAITRQLLAGVLGRPPSTIEFDYSESGKPRLRRSPLKFSLSHSGDLSALALTVDGDIGIDAEKIEPGVMSEGIIELVCSRAEKALLARGGGAERAERFFKIWTRKEAVAKCAGDGLSFPLPELETARDHALQPTVSHRGTVWHVRSVVFPAGYQGSLACQRPIDDLHLVAWREPVPA